MIKFKKKYRNIQMKKTKWIKKFNWKKIIIYQSMQKCLFGHIWVLPQQHIITNFIIKGRQMTTVIEKKTKKKFSPAVCSTKGLKFTLFIFLISLKICSSSELFIASFNCWPIIATNFWSFLRDLSVSYIVLFLIFL